MRTTIRLLALVVMGTCAASAVRADWSAPTRVGDNAYHLTNGLLFPDASNGGVISVVGESAFGWRYMNRVLPDGALADGWSGAGVTMGLGDSVHAATHAPDGVGGTWNTRVIEISAPGLALWPYFWSVELRGTRADGTRDVYLVAQEYSLSANPRLAADGTGGAFVAWNSGLSLKLTRMAANGTVAAGWPSFLTLASRGGASALAPDGSGGVFVLVAAYDGVTLGLHLLRMNAVPGWPAGWTSAGVILDTDGTPDAILPSGAAHVLACWTKSGTTCLQRVALAGAIDPAWPATGLVIPTGARRVPDGAGGLWLLTQSGTSVLLRHVLANGTWDPGFGGAGGTNPLDAGATLDSEQLAVTCAAGANGGAILAWRDVRTDTPQVRVRWLRADGTSEPSEPAVARVVVEPPAPGLTPILFDARTDDAGGAYLLWSADTTEYHYWYDYFWDCYVTRVSPGALLGVEPQAPSSLALSAGPNPARGSITVRFTLTGTDPARLELLDLAGRRVRTLEPAGAGPHTERFGDLGGLAPGVYLLRLSQDREVRTARVAIVR